MSAETSWVHRVARGWKDMAGDHMQRFKGQSSKFNRIRRIYQRLTQYFLA